MIEPFLIRAIIAGIGVAIITGAIGCFVVWRKMAYFGDSLAHSALLGVALGLVLGISTNLGTMIICSVFAILLIWLQQKKVLATDTLLGILAHAALSIGMVTLSLMERSVDLHSYLFGDILAVTKHEIFLIVFGGLVVLTFLFFNWSSFVLTTINEKLAKSEGLNTLFNQLSENGSLITVIKNYNNNKSCGKAVVFKKNKDIISSSNVFDVEVPFMEGFSKKEGFNF